MPRRDIDPYGSYCFVLELGDVEVAGFAECSGLQIETKIFEYQEGGNNATSLKFPERAIFSNITLKRGVTNSTELIDWQMDVANGTFSINHRDANSNVAIVLQDELGEPVKRWNLIRAFPVKWIGPSMKASSAEVAIETLELAHEGIQT